MMRYEQYSPSIIRWNHEYPTHWSCEKAKRFFANPKKLNKGNEESNVLSLTLRGVIRNNGEKPIGLSPSDYSTYQIFDSGELVFKLIDLNNISTSRVGMVPEKGIMSSAYIRFVPRVDMNVKYFYYQYYDWYKRNIFNGLGEGVRQTLSGTDLRNLEILVPQREEQDQIARYLDWQVSKINKLIAANKKQIALLREQKQRLVSNAVLHGIDSGESKLETHMHFVNRIPSHWRVLRGKYLFAEHDVRSQTGTEELLSVSHITGVTPRSEKNITMFKAESLIGYKVCTIDDIAANTMWMWQGAIAVSNYHGVISPSYNTYHQINNGYERRYLDYLLRAKPLVDEYRQRSTGIRKSRLRLYPAQFLSMYFPVPPKEEQLQIADYIEKQSKTIDSLISAIEDEIDKIKVLRTRLISDVVTGQIDVRGIEVPDFDMVEEIDSDEENLDDEDVGEETEEQEE